MNKGKWILKCVLVGIVFLLVMGLVIMLLWNWLVPVLFNGPHIRFFEALGLLLLSRILLGGWVGRRWGGRGMYSWKHRYHEKWSSMSPEERERFKTRLREKFQCGDSTMPPASNE